jgi:hypothetical protein
MKLSARGSGLAAVAAIVAMGLGLGGAAFTSSSGSAQPYRAGAGVLLRLAGASGGASGARPAVNAQPVAAPAPEAPSR